MASRIKYGTVVTTSVEVTAVAFLPSVAAIVTSWRHVALPHWTPLKSTFTLTLVVGYPPPTKTLVVERATLTPVGRFGVVRVTCMGGSVVMGSKKVAHQIA